MDRRTLLAAPIGGLLSVNGMAAPGAVIDADAKLVASLGRPLRAPTPVGTYRAGRLVGALLFMSTTLARTNGEPDFRGAVGGRVTLVQGQAAARAAALALLEAVAFELGGSLARVASAVSVIGYVSSADGFFAQASVIDGASQALIEVLGPEKGLAARSAVGVKAMTRDATVALSGIFEIGTAR